MNFEKGFKTALFSGALLIRPEVPSEQALLKSVGDLKSSDLNTGLINLKG